MGSSQGGTRLLVLLPFGRIDQDKRQFVYIYQNVLTLTVLTLLCTQIIEVVNKTLAFHTSVNYQIQAPPPYDKDVHEDLVVDLARMSEESYSSEFDFHIDIYRSFKRVNDGHCGVFNFCYDCE